MATIIATEEIADYLNATVAPNGGRVEYMPSSGKVDIGERALDILADLDYQADGTYDGTYIWIDGTNYPVTK